MDEKLTSQNKPLESNYRLDFYYLNLTNQAITLILKLFYVLKHMYSNMKFQIFVLIVSSLTECMAIWCYQCTAATPGCNEPFNWRGIGYLGNPCVDSEDVCVKLIERKGAQEVITRDCLSNFKPFRTDIPADTYEGCRPAAKDVNLANYVNNSIKEIDVKREWYDETIWCFCFLDHRCNSASVVSNSFVGMALSFVGILFAKMLL